MARTQAEIETAVLAARDLFWRTGFDETSIDDVVAATGFNRYALYSEFGGKREVFLAALDRYHLERKQIFMAGLADEAAPPIDAIRDVFEFCIDEMASRGTGCFMCNVAGEIAARDPVVRERIATYLEQINLAFGMALERAAERGELNTNLSPTDGVRIFVTLIMGLGMAAQHGADRQDMLATLEATLASISPLGDPSARARRKKSVN